MPVPPGEERDFVFESDDDDFDESMLAETSTAIGKCILLLLARFNEFLSAIFCFLRL
jgi:hypothetical protein